MPYSTESTLPCAWPIEDISLKLLSDLFRCDTAEARRRRDQLEQQQRDAAWVDATLDALSVPALCVIATLVSRGGMLHVPDLDKLIADRFGLDRDHSDAGIHELMQRVLVAPLTSPRGTALALVAPAADRCAERVLELELTTGAGSAAPKATFTPDPAHDGGRAVIAVAMAVAGSGLTLTQAGTPHRIRLKSLAKQLGLDIDRLESLVLAACSARLLVEDAEGVLAPDRDHLRAATEGRFPGKPAVETLVTALADRPIRRTAIDNFLAACAYRGLFTCSIETLALLPGFCAGTLDGAPALAAVPPAGERAASVTPSFEVFFPPESHVRHLVDALPACEVVRIDRVIVARITKAAVAAAIAKGATADELEAALTAASRTPLPQNVSAAIRDWAGNTVVATVLEGRVIAVPAADEARVVAALAIARPRVLAPGILIVSVDYPERAITIVLKKLGIVERRGAEPAGSSSAASSATATATATGAAAARSATATATTATTAAAAAGTGAGAKAAPRRKLPAASTKAPPQPVTLRARVEAYLRSDPKSRPPLPSAPPLPRRASPPAIEVVDVNDFNDVDDFDDRPSWVDRLERWEAQHSELLSLELFDAVASALAPLSDHERQFVFGASDCNELTTRVVRVLAGSGHLDNVLDALAVIAPELVAASRPGARTTYPAGLDGAAVPWERDHVLARLEAAARTHSTLLLDLGDGRTTSMAISRVAHRGTALLALGEDEHDVSHAIRLDAIRGVAEPPARRDTDASTASARWRPVAGMKPPPGHVPCPCGSTKRYRNCCRDSAS